jgi:hypothetical protein
MPPSASLAAPIARALFCGEQVDRSQRGKRTCSWRHGTNATDPTRRFERRTMDEHVAVTPELMGR